MTDPKCPSDFEPKCPKCHISMDYMYLHTWRCTNCCKNDPLLMMKKLGLEELTVQAEEMWLYGIHKPPKKLDGTFDMRDIPERDFPFGPIPHWIKCKERMPNEAERVFAIFQTEKGKMYNMRADGWFKNTIYACRIDKERFIIEPHGPILPATHWMPQPELPND